jgi:hypothetical protein
MRAHDGNDCASGRQADTSGVRVWGGGGNKMRAGADAEQAVSRAAAISSLSPADRQHLEQFEKKLQIVRDGTQGVAQGYGTGLLVWGPGGVCKSHTVNQELQQSQAYYRVSNSHMTGRGLFDLLDKYPDAIHVLEDVEQMMSDKNAIGVLRSALWGQRRDGGRGPQERWITWTAHCKHLETLFTGGIIVISNKSLLDLPELQALKTRILCMHLHPTDNELRALMRFIAAQGFAHGVLSMDANECQEVCEYLIAESLSLHRPLDIRLLVNSFPVYLQWQEGDSGCHWKDLVAALVRERPTVFQADVAIGSRAARKAQELAIAREIQGTTTDREERRRLWEERTGKSEKALYRRLADLRGY